MCGARSTGTRHDGPRPGRTVAPSQPLGYHVRVTTPPAPSDLIRARYRLGELDSADPRRDARDRALAIAREQTLEVPSGAATPEIEAALLGRVLSVEAVDASDGGRPATGAARHGPAASASVEIGYAPELLDGSLTQFLNVVWGNVSLMEEVRLEELRIPPDVLARFPGPRHGIEGIRGRIPDGDARPLVASALKPVGLGVSDLADLARHLVRGRVDVIKDDHGLADQGLAPFAARVQSVTAAIRDENERTGHHTLYFPNVTAPDGQLLDRVRLATEVGAEGVVVCPGLVGLDALRAVRELPDAPIVMAHPSHANTAPGATRGIAPPLLIGTLWRLAGADCVIYVNARGRFAWPLDACLTINERAREPLGAHRRAFPVPAGGIQAADVGHWFRTYGPDTLLLIGGSVLEADDVTAAARAVVDAAHRAGRDVGREGAAAAGHPDHA